MSCPDGACNLSRDADVGAVEVHIEGNQKRASSNRDRAGCFMNDARSYIRGPARHDGNLFTQQFKRAAPDIFQVDAIRLNCRAFVKENRNLKFARDAFARLVRQRSAIFKRHAADWNERKYVRCAESGMNALMTPHVDQLTCESNCSHCGFNDKGSLSDKGNDGTVMIRIEVSIQNTSSRN